MRPEATPWHQFEEERMNGKERTPGARLELNLLEAQTLLSTPEDELFVFWFQNLKNASCTALRESLLAENSFFRPRSWKYGTKFVHFTRSKVPLSATK